MAFRRKVKYYVIDDFCHKPEEQLRWEKRYPQYQFEGCQHSRMPNGKMTVKIIYYAI